MTVRSSLVSWRFSIVGRAYISLTSIFAANKSTIIDKENDIKLLAVSFLESYKILIWIEQRAPWFQCKFLHLLSIGRFRFTFRSRMSCIWNRVCQIGFLTPKLWNVAFFRGSWRQKHCLGFWLFLFHIWLFLEAVGTNYQTVLAF